MKLNDSLFAEVGLADFPREEREAFLDHVQETLEMRVGAWLADGLTQDQLGEFESILESGKEEAAVVWLVETRPGYKETVQAVADELKSEIRNVADEILAASAE